MAIALITRNYDSEISKETLPVIVEFYASWCPNCARMRDIAERVAERNKEQFVFKKVDIDSSKDIADYLGIEIVPTFIVYRENEILGYTTGVLTEESLEKRIFEML